MSETDNILVCDLSNSRNQEESEYDKEDASKIKYKIIARDEFQSDKAVTRDYMLDILGRKKSRMDEEGLKKYVIATASLKKNVLDYMKIYVNRKWGTIAQNDVNLMNTLPLLQKQWAEMKLDDNVQVEHTCKSLWKLVQPGACNEFDTDWELTAQEEYMQRHSYKYSTEDDTQENNKECIAMTGTASLCACRKKLFFLATNGGHGYFLSPSAQGVIGIVSQTLSRKKSGSHRNTFVYQKAISQVSQRKKNLARQPWCWRGTLT
jgi:hypothetical protein